MPALNSGSCRVAFVFPGQGSQAVGMGLELYRRSPQARAVFDEADHALGFPLSRLCFEGPAEELQKTVNAQPAIMTMSVAALQAHADVLNQRSPSYVAGHSLGEYTALVASGALGFADALRLVRERGRLMQEAGEQYSGGMVAILGMEEGLVAQVCQESGAQLANHNAPGQIVISGSKEALARAVELAKQRGAKRVIPLSVSGAFHSALMEPASYGLAAALAQVQIADPSVPVVANTTARPVARAMEVREQLLRQLCSPVRWQQSVEFMFTSGVSTFIEIGPGQVLTSLIKRISPQAQGLHLDELCPHGNSQG